MKEQERSQIQNAILSFYDTEDTEPRVPQQTVDNADTESRLRRKRTICLCDCAIPE